MFISLMYSRIFLYLIKSESCKKYVKFSFVYWSKVSKRMKTLKISTTRYINQNYDIHNTLYGCIFIFNFEEGIINYT